MSMILGSRKQFAIEFELLPGQQAQGAWMYGKCCYWISNEMVGNYELGTSLRDVLIAYPHVAGDNGRRDGGKLCFLTTDQIFNTLEGQLFRGDIPENSARYVEEAARFLITPAVDVFDGYHSYCVSCAGYARVVYRLPTRAGICEAKVAIEAVEKSIQEFYQSLNNIYDEALAAERER